MNVSLVFPTFTFIPSSLFTFICSSSWWIYYRPQLHATNTVKSWCIPLNFHLSKLPDTFLGVYSIAKMKSNIKHNKASPCFIPRMYNPRSAWLHVGLYCKNYRIIWCFRMPLMILQLWPENQPTLTVMALPQKQFGLPWCRPFSVEKEPDDVLPIRTLLYVLHRFANCYY